jgi:phospholipid/cholesterol/gamma-HCH transport system ATP-binding protein
MIWKGKMVHYSDADGAFSSDNPFVHQFLEGAAEGPLGMD